MILILFFLLSALDDENPSADYNRCYLTIIHIYTNNILYAIHTTTNAIYVYTIVYHPMLIIDLNFMCIVCIYRLVRTSVLVESVNSICIYVYRYVPASPCYAYLLTILCIYVCYKLVKKLSQLCDTVICLD